MSIGAARQVIFNAALCALTVLMIGTDAQAIGARSKVACLSDYRAYCSAHKVGSAELRQCMRANGARLSQNCVRALVADGEISEAEVARRTAGAH